MGVAGYTFVMPRGGVRIGAGRKPRDTVRMGVSLPSTLLEELKRRETKTGVYRNRIAAIVLSDALIGGIVQR
jgi:hypothetical protein